MSSKQDEDIPVVKASPATSEEKSWIEFQRTESQAGLRRLEEAAKYLSGLSSISLTIMLGPNQEIFKALQNSNLLKAGIISWLLSILLTLAVVFPFRYRYAGDSFYSIKALHRKAARVKRTCLILGSLLYVAGLSLVVYLYLFSKHP